MLAALAIANYRSLRDVVLPLAPLNIGTGPNGSGKSSVYRALRLLAEVAQGGAVASLAREGGFASTLWAGPENITAAMRRGEVPVQGTVRKGTISLRLGFAGAGDDALSYAIDLGLPPPKPPSAFNRDPEVKTEVIWSGPVPRPAARLAERAGAALRVRDGRGWATVCRAVPPWASMLTEYADPQAAPEMLTLRDAVRAWRFYDHFRCDVQAPARAPQLGSRTPVLSGDGHDFAAALQTIDEIGDADALYAAVADAFDGAQVAVQISDDGRFEVTMQQPGMLRSLRTAELSDGTLRFLMWAVALLTPRPPPLMVLNEPETSLHPDLLPALGALIARASRETQLIVVSHATRLVAAIQDAAPADACQRIELEKSLGETVAQCHGACDAPQWHWPER